MNNDISILVTKLVDRIHEMSLGEKSRLRRNNLDAPDAPEFWELLKTVVLDPDEPISPKMVHKWAWIMRFMAQTSVNHNSRVSLGEAMARQVEESRFYRILLAQGDTALEDMLGQTLRILDSKAQDFNWGDVAILYLTDPSKLEEFKISLARIFQATRRTLLPPPSSPTRKRTMETRFVEIHALMFYPASLLNRDDSGLAKRITVGGSTRLRISSQCLKRHWSQHDGKDGLAALDLPSTIRSRVTFETEIVKPLVALGIYNEASVRLVVEGLMDIVLGKSEKAKKTAKKETEKKEEKEKKKKASKEEKAKKGAKEDDEAAPAPDSSEGPTAPEGGSDDGLETKQVVVLGRPEVNYLLRVSREILDTIKDPKDAEQAFKGYFASKKNEFKTNLQAIPMGCGLNAAMFGRMATGDALSRYDSAVSVAHGITVHAAQTEADYFSAVDTLASQDRGVSGHLNSTELSTGLYYVYACVDVRQLVSNMIGCPKEEWKTKGKGQAVIADVVIRLLRMIATVSTGAKHGSTAPFTYASTLLVRMGDEEPMQFSEAFLKPVKPGPTDNLLEQAQQALAEFILDMNFMYGPKGLHGMASRRPHDSLKALLKTGSVPDLEAWISDCISSGTCTPFQPKSL